MRDFREQLGKVRLYADGGSGTVLQSMGLRGGELPETWNLTHPEEVITLHSRYLSAGSDIIYTNTFGANRLKYPENLEEIVKAAVNNVREARRRTGREDAWIALDLGPTGKLLEPVGDLPFEEAVKLYAEVVKIGVQAGCDLIVIETMSSGYEAKAAVLAAKENSDLPVICTVTFDAKGKMLTGESVEAVTATLEGLRVDALGINCSLGPKEMAPVIRRMAAAATVPLIVKPNAGLPKEKHGRTYYDVTPQDFSDAMDEIADLGVAVAGGCCGTTPEHIDLLIRTLDNKPFVLPAKKAGKTVVSSWQDAVEIGERTVIIGERINPTGKKRFKQALREHDISYILQEALNQETAGADVLDVNLGLPEIDEAAMMEETVKAIQSITGLPLQIDTSDPEALERGLRIYNGKPLINSVSGKRESMDTVFPLAARYGGVIVALCLDEDGIPETAEGRIRIAKKIYAEAERYGIRREDILIDGLAMTISADSSSAVTTLDTIRRVKEELHGRTILGVSNISFGLPQRPLVNAAFLAMAMREGLSAAIINPGNEQMMSACRAALALNGQDPQCAGYINAYANAQVQTVISAGTKVEVKAEGNDLSSCIERGLVRQTETAAAEALKTAAPMEIISRDLIPALDRVGKGFENGTVFLPQLLMSADAAKAAFAVIKASVGDNSAQNKGRVILATVKGDIHDIGKNIVKVMLENYGYEVLDLGKDVAPEIIVDTAIRENIRLVGLSALMTTTVVSMEETIKLLREKKPDTKVVVGGAVMTQEYADRIGADAYAKDAMATVRYADSVFGTE